MWVAFFAAGACKQGVKGILMAYASLGPLVTCLRVLEPFFSRTAAAHRQFWSIGGHVRLAPELLAD